MLGGGVSRAIASCLEPENIAVLDEHRHFFSFNRLHAALWFLWQKTRNLARLRG